MLVNIVNITYIAQMGAHTFQLALPIIVWLQPSDRCTLLRAESSD
jgi:hypothetical protein